MEGSPVTVISQIGGNLIVHVKIRVLHWIKPWPSESWSDKEGGISRCVVLEGGKNDGNIANGQMR